MASERPPARRRKGLPRRRLPGPAAAASLAAVAAVGAILYAASFSVPYLAASPAADPLLGALDMCLLAGLTEPAAGFAVSPDGARAAAFGGDRLVLCARSPGRGAPAPLAAALAGVSLAAFDFEGGLWLVTAPKEGREGRLWRWPPGAPAPADAGAFEALALAGHRGGVAGVESSGRLFSMDARGRVLGFARLSSPLPGAARLSATADGSLLALESGGALLLFRAPELSPLRLDAPCEVKRSWWLPQPARLLLSCSPPGRAFILDTRTGVREPAVLSDGVPSELIPGASAYIRSCGGLPCQGPSPLP